MVLNVFMGIRCEKSDCFKINREMRQGFEMSQRLFTIFMDGVLREEEICLEVKGYKSLRMMWYGCCLVLMAEYVEDLKILSVFTEYVCRSGFISNCFSKI